MGGITKAQAFVLLLQGGGFFVSLSLQTTANLELEEANMKQLRREQQKTRGAGLRFAQCGAPLEAPPYLELEQRQQMEDFGQEPCIAWLRGSWPAASSPLCPVHCPAQWRGRRLIFCPAARASACPARRPVMSKPAKPAASNYVGGAGGPCQIGPRLPGAARTAGQRGLPLLKPLCPCFSRPIPHCNSIQEIPSFLFTIQMVKFTEFLLL